MISVDNTTINFSLNSKFIYIENLIIVGSEKDNLTKLSNAITGKFEDK